MFDDRTGKELLLGSPDVAPDAGGTWASCSGKEIAAAALATTSALVIIGTFVGYAAGLRARRLAPPLGVAKKSSQAAPKMPVKEPY